MERNDTFAPKFQRLYICSPYRGKTGKASEIELNAWHACGYCRKIVEKYDYTIPVAPHVYLPQFMDASDTDPEQRETALALGQAMLATCDALLVFGEFVSEGMKAEIKEAVRLGIPVYNGHAYLLGRIDRLPLGPDFWEREVGIPEPEPLDVAQRIKDLHPTDRELALLYIGERNRLHPARREAADGKA